jgi:hypothetical protein
LGTFSTVSTPKISGAVYHILWIVLLSCYYAAFLRVTCIPALVARVISISRLNLSHLPLIKSETLD